MRRTYAKRKTTCDSGGAVDHCPKLCSLSQPTTPADADGNGYIGPDGYVGSDQDANTDLYGNVNPCAN